MYSAANRSVPFSLCCTENLGTVFPIVFGFCHLVNCRISCVCVCVMCTLCRSCLPASMAYVSVCDGWWGTFHILWEAIHWLTQAIACVCVCVCLSMCSTVNVQITFLFSIVFDSIPSCAKTNDRDERIRIPAKNRMKIIPSNWNIGIIKTKVRPSSHNEDTHILIFVCIKSNSPRCWMLMSRCWDTIFHFILYILLVTRALLKLRCVI